MIELLRDWWEMIVGSTLVTTATSYIGFKLRRIDRLEKEKADRSEVVRMFELMEQRIDKRDDEARQGRRELHKKLDGISDKQSEINREVARFMGRFNGQ